MIYCDQILNRGVFLFEQFRTQLKDIGESFLESGAQVSASIVGEVFLDGIIGVIAPGLVTVTLGYKQKRMERNIFLLIEDLTMKIGLMQEKWDYLNPDKKQDIKEKFAGIICDYVIDEKEPEKIEYLANGFVSTVTSDILNGDMIVEYYDICEKLRLIELQYLIDLYNGSYRIYANADEKLGGSYRDTIDEHYLNVKNLSENELSYIKDKLFNLRLLNSDRDEKYRRFFENTIKHIDNENTRRFPRLTKPSFVDHYSLSPLGKQLICFFTLEVKKT